MNFPSPENSSNPKLDATPTHSQAESGLARLAERISKTLTRDALVKQVTDHLQYLLQVDRVVLYYFYRQWQGQVTFESLSAQKFSIFGMTGADECFKDEYATMYLEGRVRAIADIDLEPIHDCHRQFLHSIQVRANLVVPIVTAKGLWGLLVAHHCQAPRSWSEADIKLMRDSAKTLATSSSIK